MNRWIAHTVRLGAPLLMVGLTWAGDATAAQSPTVSAEVKQAALTGIDPNLGNSTLQPGDTGADVRKLQQALDRNFIDVGAFDGVYGPTTGDAVAIYQSERRLPVTGIADSTTLQDMGFILPGASSRTLPPPTQVQPAVPVEVRPVESNPSDLRRRRLEPGNTGADVSALQSALNSFGFNVVVDGVYGGGTAEAVRTYQRIQNLPVTGVADSDTLEDMGFNLPRESEVVASSPAVASRGGELSRGQLGPGDTGADVRALQRALRDFGLPVTVDGEYGPGTTSAVRTYQRTRDLRVTGVADQDTLEDIGFEVPNFRYIAAVVGGEAELAEVRRYFPNAYIDSNIEGEFINIGNFDSRDPAEARSFAARGRDLDARVIYRRSGLF
ncbi:MAG: peptidoglycan-binding domain-containing protein [Cyanobacteria bacterium J06635_1]